MVETALFSLGAHVLFVGSILLLFRIEFQMPRFLTAILTLGVLLLELGVATVGAFAIGTSLGITTSFAAIVLFVGAVGIALVQ
jgi:hypothetical protein